MPAKYVLYSLRATEQELRTNSTGTTFEAIRGDDLRSHSIPLAPLAEQRRIVVEIETQFTRLDVSVAALRRARANLKRYRASVLKDACEGRLVPTEADLAPSRGPRLRTRRRPAGAHPGASVAPAGSRRRSGGASTRNPPPPTPPPFRNCRRDGRGSIWISSSIYWKAERLLPLQTMFQAERCFVPVQLDNGFIDLEDYRFLPDDVNKTSDPYIASGDLLFTRLSGTLKYVGNCAVVGELNGQRLEFPDRIFRGRCTTSLSPHYIQNCFSTKALREDLEARAKSSAGHQRLSLSDLRQFCIPLPPLAEQRRIVAEVERRLSVVQQAEATVEASLARAERLRQSILKQAFSGRLVPQDPNDEPASALLERIRAKREAEMREHPPRKRKSPGRGRKGGTK